MLRVQQQRCSTCIFKESSPLNLEHLLDEIRDNYGGFEGHRICHHSNDAVCAGFWEAHKNDFQLGQVAQRLNCVELVNDDTLSRNSKAQNELPNSR